MERYTMFLDWKNQHCENEYTTQSNLQIQGNPYQTTNGIFHRNRTKNFTVCMVISLYFDTNSFQVNIPALNHFSLYVLYLLCTPHGFQVSIRIAFGHIVCSAYGHI